LFTSVPPDLSRSAPSRVKPFTNWGAACAGSAEITRLNIAAVKVVRIEMEHN